MINPFQFFHLNKNNGFVNWKQSINSDIRPILTEKILFTVSSEGILFVIDSVNGNIVKSQWLRPGEGSLDCKDIMR